MVYKSITDDLKPKKGKKPLVITLVILLVLVLTAGAFGLLYFFDLLPFGKKAPEPYVAEGQMYAFTLAPPAQDVTQQGMREYFADAVVFAKENGYNTILFEAKQGIHVYWRDRIFPVSLEIAKQDGFIDKLDPLELLMESVQGQEIQVWLKVNPYTTAGYTEGDQGKVSDLVKDLGGASVLGIQADHQEYAKLVHKSLKALPRKYGVAGIVLEGSPGVDSGGDAASFATAYQSLLETLAEEYKEKEYQTGLALSFDGEKEYITPEMATDLAGKGTIQYVFPQLNTGKRIVESLAKWGETGAGLVAVHPVQDTAGLLLFAAAQTQGFAGVQIDHYPNSELDAGQLNFLKSGLLPGAGTLPQGFTIPQTLQVNFPLPGIDKIPNSQEQVFVMGNSDPSKPLLLDGTEVARSTTGGSFGVLVQLAEGDNIFTFSQGDTVLEHTITRTVPVAPPVVPVEPEETEKEPGTEEPAKPSGMPWDNTREAKEGEAVKVVGVFTGALTDYTKTGSMNETFYGGAVVVPRGNVETTRYDADRGRTVKTWAYLLPSGDYVLARDCVFIEGDGLSSFTGITAQTTENGEWLTFEGTGTPGAYISCEEQVLKVTMYDTTFTLPEGFSSELVESAWVEQDEYGAVLNLKIKDLWGYSINYEEGKTRLFLKRAPELSLDPAKPLSGVRIMVDPGHGADDIGAAGVMGAKAGPNEKDVNLAQAQAIEYRLSQLGAEVIMIRNDDTFYTTQERLAMQIEAQPDFFISVHHNSAELNADRNGAMGAQVYYHIPSGYSAPLAKAYGQNLMNGVAGATGRHSSDAAWGYYNVIRTPVCPSVLFEYGFMVSPQEFEDVASRDGLYAAACGTAEGILASMPEGKQDATQAVGEGAEEVLPQPVASEN